MAQNRKTGLSQNWVKSESPLVRRSDAKKTLKNAKVEEMSKKYVRIPHPTLKNTFILKEKE
jgi:hypothetical protein